MRINSGRNRFDHEMTGWCVAVLALASTWTAVCPTWATTVYSGSEALTLDERNTELIIELDGSRSDTEVSADLAEEGLGPLARVEEVPERFNFWRLSVAGMNGDPTETLRGVAGIRAARSTYHVVEKDTELILSGQIVLNVLPSVGFSEVTAMSEAHGAFIESQIAGLPDTYVLRLVDEWESDVVSAAASLHDDARAVYSHPSLFQEMALNQVVIEDPLYPFQWHLHNTSQLDEGKVDADIDAPEAWEITLGEGAVVAVVDDAINWSHEDLVDNYQTGFDFAAMDNDPNPGGGENHGTAVTGLICAKGNDLGVRGVAPEARFIACRALYGSPQDIALANALLFSEASGAMAINNSWGGPGMVIVPTVPNTLVRVPGLINAAITQVATQGRGGLGCLVLFASGNGERRTLRPLPISFGNTYAAHPNTMAIGASMRNDLLSCYSNFGAEQSVVAPSGGVSRTRSQLGGLGLFTECLQSDMTTTDVMDSLGLPTRGYNPPTRMVGPIQVIDPEVIDFPDLNYHNAFSGTSAACPVAAGVAALVYSVDAGYRAYEVRNLMEHTAEKIIVPNERWDPVTGHNLNYGHGRVNAHQAVLAAQQADTWPSPVKDIDLVTSQGFVLLFWSFPDWDLDGIADGDVSGVLVARARKGRLEWGPEDGVDYAVGEEVAPGVVIAANSLIEELDQTGLETGDYDFAMWTRNPKSFYSWGRRLSTTVDNPFADEPRISIRATPATKGQAPLAVLLAAGGLDPFESGFVTYTWDFDDGTTGTGAAVEHTFTQAGIYTVNVTAAPAAGGLAFSNVLITVDPEDNLLPLVQATATPVTGDAPLTVLFEGGANDPDGTVVSYVWDFGDGTTGTGTIAEHVYINPGSYGASLTVTDNRGATGTAIIALSVTGSGPASETAGQTAPQGLLGNPTCASGAGGASLASLAGLFCLRLVRVRRRRR